MSRILWGKWLILKRKPGGVLVSTILCIVFALLLGLSSDSKIEVPVAFDVSAADRQEIIASLNDNETFQFTDATKEDMEERVAEGKVEAGLEVNEEGFTLFQARETANFYTIQNFVQQFYQQYQLQQAVAQTAEQPEQVLQDLKNAKDNPAIPISFKENDVETTKRLAAPIFGFPLFFAIYLIALTVVDILKEKQNGIWDRYILSPTSKTSIFLGNLLFSFLIGYLQMIVTIVIITNLADIDLSGNFFKVLLVVIPYVFTIVAFSILLTGLVKSVTLFNILLPLLTVSFAMLGGAWWPLELIESDVLLMLAKISPITYGMELLKGVIVLNKSISELLYPLSILLLMGVLMMGIGIRLIERKQV
ncbi:ABC transporter permease [Bacillaceae bacterium Marseille-Q3522]|nr:ABC transporter permease [Bacillaceae bacterium Marseille-Q3522]